MNSLQRCFLASRLRAQNRGSLLYICFSSSLNAGAASTSPNVPLNPNSPLEHKLGDLERKWCELQNRLDKAKYILGRNPHASRGRGDIERVRKGMEQVHAEYQRELQRAGTASVSSAEIVLSSYCQIFRPSSWHYNVLMDSFKRHQPRQCEVLLERMDRDGVAPDVTTFNIMLDAMIMRGAKLPELEAVVQQMTDRGLVPDRYTHSSILIALAHTNDIETVEAALQAMLNRAELPSTDSLGALLSMYGMQQRYDSGEPILEAMLSDEHQLSARNYTAILRFCLRKGDVGRVEAIWDEMEEKGFRPPEEIFEWYLMSLFGGGSGPVSPDVITTEKEAALEKLLCRAKAASVRLNLVPATPMLLKFVDKGASLALSSLMRALMQASPDTKEEAFEHLTLYFMQTGRVEQVKAALDALADAGLSPQTVANAMVSRGVFTMVLPARQLLQHMWDERIPIYKETLFNVMFACSNRGDIAGCNEAGDLMEKLGITPSEHVLNAHMRACVQANKLSKLYSLVDKVRELGYRVYVPNAQVLVVDAGPKLDLAMCDYLLPMLKHEGRVPTFLEYDAIVAAAVASGDPHRALGALQEMMQVGHSPSKMLLGEVIGLVDRAGLLAEAESLLIQCLDLVDLPLRAVNELAKRAAWADKVDAAERICCIIEEVGSFPAKVVLNALLMAYGRKGMLIKAQTTFAVMKERRLTSNPHTLSAMICVLARHAKFEECGDIVRELRLHDFFMNLTAFRTLLCSFSEQGLFNEAEATYRHFHHHYVDVSGLFKNLGRAYGRHGMEERLRSFAASQAPSPEVAALWNKKIDIGLEKKRQKESRSPTI